MWGIGQVHWKIFVCWPKKSEERLIRSRLKATMEIFPRLLREKKPLNRTTSEIALYTQRGVFP